MDLEILVRYGIHQTEVLLLVVRVEGEGRGHKEAGGL